MTRRHHVDNPNGVDNNRDANPQAFRRPVML